MISQEDLKRLGDLRSALHDEIRACLEIDGHCKSYEGAFSVRFPCVFDGDPWLVMLDCYVVGPSRHYHWEGDTMASALEKCEADVYEWIKQSAEWRSKEAADAATGVQE